jgi:hypothetical protein
MAPFIVAVSAILVGIGCWILLKSRHRPGLPSLNKRKSGQSRQAAETTKQMPDFINEMRRKDQSMNVESPKTEIAEFDLQEICRKEKVRAGQRLSKSG